MIDWINLPSMLSLLTNEELQHRTEELHSRIAKIHAMQSMGYNLAGFAMELRSYESEINAIARIIEQRLKREKCKH